MAGLGNHRLLGTSQFIGHARARDDALLMVHGGVPFVRRAKHSGVRISGEIYSITDATGSVLAAVDRLEGHPDWYRRTPLVCVLDESGHHVDAEVYLNDAPLLDEGTVRVPSGNFRMALLDMGKDNHTPLRLPLSSPQ
jgi:gamma-glutamylaminecyclotransferase